MVCKKCGRELEEYAKFCDACGTMVQNKKEFEKKRSSKKKWMMILLVLLAIGGVSVYAYHLLSTPAVNEFNMIQNPGGRLHDDFNGKLMQSDDYAEKRIYVENFTKKDRRGIPLYVRVQIKEYMEIGQGAGGNTISKNSTSTKDPIKIVGSNLGVLMYRDRKETWNTYLYDEITPVGDALSMYRTLKWAGESLKSPNVTTEKSIEDFSKIKKRSIDTVSSSGIQVHNSQMLKMTNENLEKKYYYMPTFNKNKEDGSPDINGSIKGAVDPKNGNWTENADALDIEKRYNNYVEYKQGDKKTANAIYAGNDTTPNDIVQENIKTIQEEHEAKELPETKVISMKQWRELPETEQIGPYWVYDKDGWAYWAEPLQPETATSMLLKGIELHQTPSSEWYYGISVVGDFASLDSAKDFKNITDDALFFLSVIKNKKPEVAGIQNITNDLNVDNCIFAQANKTTTLKADVQVSNPSGGTAEKDVLWSSQDPEIQKVLDGNLIRPTDEMVGKKYILTVTSGYDKEKSKDITVYVYPSDANKMIRGSDQMVYVEYEGNVYRSFSLTTGEIGDGWICAGADKKIGTGDDLYQVVDAGRQTSFGRYFIGPIDGKYYQYAGGDYLLGTGDDKYVVSLGGQFPDDLTANFVKKIKVTAKENGVVLNEQFVHPNTKIEFEAQLIGQDDSPLPLNLQKVRWDCTRSSSNIDSTNNVVYIYKSATSADSFKMQPIPVLVSSSSEDTVKDYYIVDYTWKDIEKIQPFTSQDSHRQPVKIQIGSTYWKVVYKNTIKKHAYLISDQAYPISFNEIQPRNTKLVPKSDWQANPSPWASELQPNLVEQTFNRLLEENIEGSGSEKIKDRAVHSVINEKRLYDNIEAEKLTTDTRQITKQMFLPSYYDMGIHEKNDIMYIGNEYVVSPTDTKLPSEYNASEGHAGIYRYYLSRTIRGYDLVYMQWLKEHGHIPSVEVPSDQDKSCLWYGLSLYNLRWYSSEDPTSFHFEKNGNTSLNYGYYYVPAMVFYYGEDDPSQHIGNPIAPEEQVGRKVR